MFFGQPDFFCFMPDEQAFALSQSVLHLLRANLDVQHLTAAGRGKSLDSVVFGLSAGDVWRACAPAAKAPFRLAVSDRVQIHAWLFAP